VLEIIIIIAVLSIVLASLKLSHGQSDNLTVNQTRELKNQTEAYDSVLMGVIKNANVTIPSDLHPTTKQLDQIADEIVEGGHPNKILNDIRQNKS
jgi:type II secretory pathway pseudopilin PulG